jgi:hypothetical protein
MSPLEFKLYVALKDMLPDSECNRLTNGVCQTRKCLIEGGWKPSTFADYDLATCPGYRARQAIKAFDNALEREI